MGSGDVDNPRGEVREDWTNKLSHHPSPGQLGHDWHLLLTH